MGFELRVPLGGNGKARQERAAAELRKKQALLQIQETETQVLNAVQTARMKVQNTHDNVGNYQEVVRFDEELLQTQLTRVEAGPKRPRPGRRNAWG